MRVGVLITNNATHSPRQWAAETAAHLMDIVQIDPASIVADSMRHEKSRLTTILEASLEPFHDEVQKDEKTMLTTAGLAHLNTSNLPEPEHLQRAVDTVCAATDQSMFNFHFRKPEVVDFIRATLGSHFTTVRHIERSTFADRNPGAEESKIFHARFV